MYRKSDRSTAELKFWRKRRRRKEKIGHNQHLGARQKQNNRLLLPNSAPFPPAHIITSPENNGSTRRFCFGYSPYFCSLSPFVICTFHFWIVDLCAILTLLYTRPDNNSSSYNNENLRWLLCLAHVCCVHVYGVLVFT